MLIRTFLDKKTKVLMLFKPCLSNFLISILLITLILIPFKFTLADEINLESENKVLTTINETAIFVYSFINSIFKKQKTTDEIITKDLMAIIPAGEKDETELNLITAQETQETSIPTIPTTPTETATTPSTTNLLQPFIVTTSGITEEEFTRRLNILENSLKAEIYRMASQLAPTGSITPESNFQAIALSQIIDNLDLVTISRATITGSTFTGSQATITNLASTDLNTTNLTVSGTSNFSGNTNLSNASSTRLTVSDYLWIGDEDADSLNIRAGLWTVGSTATTTVAMTNGLNFDNNTFTIDPNSNRIGILTSTPNYELDINGTFRAVGNSVFDSNLSFSNIAASINIGGISTTTATQFTTSGNYLFDTVGDLSINTTNNSPTTFGTGITTIPNASSTQVTVSDKSWLGNLLTTGNTISSTNDSGVAIYDNDSNGVNIIDGGNVGIGSTTPAQKLSVDGNTYITGGLGVGVATTTAGVIETSGDVKVGGNLQVSGNSMVIGDTISDTLIINSSINSDLVPDLNAMRDLGTPAYYWDDVYADSLFVNNLSAASTTISGTQSEMFTINSNNSSADTEDMDIVFFRGTVVPNALIEWNSTLDIFDINQPIFIQNDSSTTTVASLEVRATSGQTADVLKIADSTGSTYLNVDSNGNVGIGTTTPTQKLDVVGNINVDSASAYLYDGSQALKLAKGTDTYYANTYVGVDAGNSSVAKQTAIGYGAGQTNSGTNQTAIGYEAGNSNTRNSQTAIGYVAGKLNTGNLQTVVGHSSGLSNTGDNQTAIGFFTGYQNTGDDQTVIGFQAGRSNIGGNQTAIGYQSGYQNTGDSQAAMGYMAGYQNTGIYQTALGFSAGRQNSGDYVTGIGSEALRENTASNVVAIGYQAGYLNTVANQFILKQANINATPLIQGDFATGNIGIGTASPGAKLQVDGNVIINDTAGLEIQSGSGTTIGSLFNSSGVLTLNSDTTRDVKIGSDSYPNSVFVEGSNGNVGIGTASPGAKLEVSGDGEGIAISSGSYVPVFIGPYGVSGGNEDIGYLRMRKEGTNKIVLNADGNSYFNAGNVGIGTTAPTQKLDVAGNGVFANGAAVSTLLRIVGGTDATAQNAVLGLRNENTNNDWEILMNSSASDRLEFQIEAAPKMAITTGGNVGIGTTAPSARLSIEDTTSPQMRIAYDSIKYTTIGVDSDGGVTLAPSVANATTTIGNGDESFRIDSDGNVGIGGIDPTYQLQLSTNSAAKPGTAYWTVASDERLKDVNGDFTRGLSSLEGLYPVYFNYSKGNAKNIPYDREYVGLIAQDVQKVIPEAVNEDKEGYLAIETDAILWTMLNSIKELALKVGSDNITYTKDTLQVLNDTGEPQMKLAYDQENLAEFKVSAVGDLSLSTAGKDIRLPDDNMQICSGGACPTISIPQSVISASLSAAAENEAFQSRAVQNFETLTRGTGNLIVENVAYINGALGVGTPAPGRIMDVYESQSDPQMRISYDEDLYSEFNVSATGDLTISASGGDVSVLNENLRVCSDEGCPSIVSQIQDKGNLVVENSLLALGNVGIGGIVSPDYTLDVHGTLRAYGITDASDIRLKTNIRPLSSSISSSNSVFARYEAIQDSLILQNIQKLRGVKFEWKDSSFGTGDQIGFIAQEVEKVYPELVSTDNDGLKSVQYGKFTAVLLEAIKDLINWGETIEYRSARLEDRTTQLEKENASLKQKTQSLESRIEALENILRQ